MKKTILMIDDDIELNEEISEILKDEGYDVVSAFDGAEGIKLIEKNTYDIILLDFKMPGHTDGIGVIKKIKKMKVKSAVFLISGRPHIEKLLKDENLESIVTKVLSKPFHVVTLLEEIKNIVE
ncbi:MAG: hypothetical protein A2452_13310 [Candidatus Firestonebacteria bacterium RIFOXYC2_FULL_39_67]|nr:MAG: hypothetical protein A2536_01170 [Candidatus Firestonebacteria bacterium RIFOXYD2_FULL_39_29]OGF56297.1 MAG: hypothetical protein A2452_13310 [Candidatus Firestonebacteria bacterium RIFOXYC2_FULL_39_67]